MKKFSFLLFILISCFICFGCKKNKQVEYIDESDQENKSALSVTYSGDVEALYNKDWSPEDFAKDLAEDISFELGEEGGFSESVIPGIRKLSEYTTKYATKRSENGVEAAKSNEKASKNKAKIKKDDTKAFFVEEWGPQEEIVSESDTPSFYVIFSKPAKALTALEKPSATSDYMKIEPKLNGVFRWYGNQHLSFEASEAPDPTVEYKIIVSPKIKSLDGDVISGETVFVTKAAPIEIKQLYAGYIENSEYEYREKVGAIPPYDKRFFLRLNYAISVDKFNQIVEVMAVKAEKVLQVSAEPIYGDKYLFSWGSNKTVSSEIKKQTNTFIVTIKEELPRNDMIQVSARAGQSVNYKHFLTMQPFMVTSVDKACEYSGKHKFPLTLRFTQTPDIKTAVANIKFDVEYPLTEDNFEVHGSTLKVYDLPFDYDQEHTVTILDGLKDVFGQSLLTSGTYTFKTLSPKSYIKYLDLGANILEAQFAPKYIFEYQNLMPNSWYRVYNTEKPWDTDYNHGSTNVETIGFNSENKNKRQFEEIDLSRFLKNGYGFVRIDSYANYEEWNRWSEKMENVTNKRVTTIQVTDLGVTARVGINKASVLVSSLKTGKPVKNADVYILPYNETSSPKQSKESYCYGKGKTNADGLASITFNESDIQRFENDTINRYRGNSVLIYVENGDDAVLFSPNSHYARGEGIYNRNPSQARRKNQKTFMFVDRGLYRPGETVTFRGIDRTLQMGQYKIYNGSYNIVVKENSWKTTNIVTEISGSVSKSGGFYGSFKLPDTLAPGNYKIEYKRTGEKSSQSINFIVAEFERLKFESSVAIPNMKYYNGDSISGLIQASYLAGGGLAGANYTASWFYEPSRFSPSTAETKGYTFGGNNYSNSRDLLSQSSGVLSAEGKASVSCKTAPISDGRPYRYRLSAVITDISNQQIVAQNSVTVHPALFYVGIARPASMTGFAKKGQQLDFPYILVNADGKQLKSLNNVSELKYKLLHEEWTVAHEQSIYNSIYTRYTRQDVVEQEGKIKAESRANLSLTPKASGWYTLEVTGVDDKQNTTITKYGFYVTGGKSYWYNDNDGNAITLTPNQTQYNPGETAEILLESQLPEGDYLITVERESIISEEVRHFDSPANVITIPIEYDYTPVVYVSVSSYSVRNGEPKHQYGEVDMDKPKGYYGVTALHVNPNVKSFKVDISCDKPSYRPGDEVTITLKATRGGKPFAGAELTLMAVDRGVIDLIDYHVPNPISFFYDEYNFPLYILGGDSRAYLMDPVTYSVKDLAGGDAAEEEKENERKDFRPTAVFEPELITGEDGTVKCTFKMPDSLTTYRITVFGVSNDLFALQENEVKVQNPVNVQAVQPRKLRVRDTAECGVLITNLGAETETVTVMLEARTPTGNTVQDEQEGRVTIPGKAFVDGPTEHTVHVESGRSSVVYFDVAAEKEGTVELVYHIKSDNLNEKLVNPIRIEESYVYETVTMTSSTEDSQEEVVVIPGFSKNMNGDLNFILDATRLGPLSSAVDYVFKYPYGCNEQKTAALLPLLIFEDYIDVFELDKSVSNVKKCVTSTLKRISKSQLSNGGFPYWPDGIYDTPYVSARIGHICAIGLKHGYKEKELHVNIQALERYLKDNAFQRSYTFQKAYIAYVLAMLGDSEAEAYADKVQNEIKNCNNTALSYLGLAYAELGKKSKAENAAKELRKYIQSAERSVTILPRDGEYFDIWYSSDSSSLALALQLYVTLNPEDKLVDRLIETLMHKKSNHGYWNNTSDTARVLESVYTYIKKRNLDSLDFTANASFNGTKVLDANFKGVAAKPVSKKVKFTEEPVSSAGYDKEIPVEFAKTGTGTLFYTVEMHYALPDEIISSRDEGIGIEYTITDAETGEVINLKEAVTPLKSGKTYKASIKVQSSRNRNYLAVRAPIPSGAEIIDSTFVTSADQAAPTQENARWRQRLSKKTIYDNEVQFFWDYFGSGATTVNFTFRAGRRGVYPTPPVQAECMYEPEIFGRSNGSLFIIQ